MVWPFVTIECAAAGYQLVLFSPCESLFLSVCVSVCACVLLMFLCLRTGRCVVDLEVYKCTGASAQNFCDVFIDKSATIWPSNMV